MRLYPKMLSLLLLSAFGCQTEFVSRSIVPAPTSQQKGDATQAPAANFRIKKTVVNGDNGGLGPLFVTAHFDYVKERDLKQVFIPSTPTGGRESTTEYIYDNQGRFHSYQVRYDRPNDNGIAGYLNMFTYGNNTVEESFAQLRADGQKVPYKDSNEQYIYRTNNKGQITELIQEGIIRFGQLTRARYVYTYENGNVIKTTLLDANDKVELTWDYEYDDKQNPFYDWMYTFDAPLRNSKNNITGVRINNGTTFRTEYTYSANGLPLTKKNVTKGAVLTYEYETF